MKEEKSKMINSEVQKGLDELSDQDLLRLCVQCYLKSRK